MAFVSKSIAKNGDGYAVTGDLTLHGVTKPVVLTMEPPSGEVAMGKQTRRGFDATTTIHRKDFGLTYDETLTKAGDAMIGDDVKVTLEVEADQTIETRDEQHGTRRSRSAAVRIDRTGISGKRDARHRRRPGTACRGDCEQFPMQPCSTWAAERATPASRSRRALLRLSPTI